MQAAPYLLSFLLIFLQQSGWTQGFCNVKNGTEARCDNLKDLKNIEMPYLEILQVPIMQDVLTPGLFNNLTNLEHLDLSGGHLKKIKSGSFRLLSNLKSLNLGENRIENLELASLEGLTHLRSLNLRKNAIRQLPPALMRLKNLKHLDVYGNPIECNCATLKVRDLLVQRGASLSKKIVCASPSNMKGTSLMKSSATIVCSFEQQDREMQNDQAEGSGTDVDFEDEIIEEEDNSVEYQEINNSTEKPVESEVETPFPTASETFTTGSSTIELTASTKESVAPAESTVGITTSPSLQYTDDDEEIFFDNEDKKEQSTTEMSQKKEEIKDALFYPTYGSGDEDEGSGEGSGAGVSAHYDEERTEKDNTKDDSSITGTLWDLVFGGFMGTTAATEVKDPDLEEEQFIDVSSTEEPSKVPPIKSEQVTTDASTTSVSVSDVEVLKSADTDDKAGNVKFEVNSLNDEQADVSPAKQPKKGMGSYVVLAILLAVVATLIGVAAYRGDICRKKRKRGDVENGTEMKDMQKSLLPDTGNATQPKITSNGNAESVPLVEGASEKDNEKIDKIQSDNYQTQETPRSHNGTGDHQDPVKPPRKLITSQDDEKDEERPRVDVNSLRDNFFADRTSPTQPSESSITTNNVPDGPPLSPGAQRVKITLQENPDSVPKTPILITRTMAGENLVKTP